MGPELAHLTASALYRDKCGEGSLEYWENILKYYKLAHTGYHLAWGRLRSLPGITDREITLDARLDWDREQAKPQRNIPREHHHGFARFGSSPARSIQTVMKLGHIYSRMKVYPEAVYWMTQAVQGFHGLYGDLHDETISTRDDLLYIFKKMGDFGKAYALSKLTAMNHMKRWGGGLVSLPGATIAFNMGECASGLANFKEASRWYQITLRGIASFYGEDDRSQIRPLQSLARVENFQHNHTSSLQYALRAERIWHLTKGQKTPPDNLDLTLLTEIQLEVALQHLERGNSKAAREWCEKVFVGPKWTPLEKETPSEWWRTLEDMRLEATWVYACIEHGDPDVQEWEIPAFNIGKDFTREACSRFGPLRNPCCAGVDRGTNGYRRLTHTEEIQILVDEADELVRSWDQECEMRRGGRQLASSGSTTDQG